MQPGTERGAAAAPNPSLNHQVTEEQQQRELAELIARQERQALEPQDDRQRFAMFADFMPPVDALQTQLKIAGLPADSLTAELLSGFKGFFVAKTSVLDTAAGWCFKLVGWIKRERAQAAGTAFSEED